ncbi:hypothetical protein D3C76_585220 [compost metagenome]
MVRRQQLRVLHARVLELVVVVRDVDLALAEHLPFVAVRSAVEQAVLVDGTEAAGAGRGVVTDRGRATYPPGARQVLPALPRADHGVDELVTGDDLALGARRLEGGDHEVGHEPAGERLAGALGVRPGREDLVIHGLQGLGAVGVGHRLVVDRLFAADACLQPVVPDQLIAVLRNREGRGAIGTDHRVAAIGQFGVDGVVLDSLLDHLAEAEVAMRRVHRNAEGFRIALEHGALAVGEILGVLLHVLRCDLEQRLLIGVGIGIGSARPAVVHVRRGAAPLAAPGGNAAVGVAGLFRAHRGQFLAKTRGLFRTDLGLYLQTGTGKAGGEEEGEQVRCSFHVSLLWCQKLYFAVSEMLSRSASGLSLALPRNTL